MTKLDYWMYGTIIGLMVVPTEKNHLGCNLNCNNRFCELGQYNLIKERLINIKQDLDDQFLLEL